MAVHPHVCGEYSFLAISPNRLLRFIPTCVGNTRSDIHVADDGTVHPHVCGEYEINL